LKTEFATFGKGCYSEVKEYFMQVPGVINVVTGFAGGDWINPDYNDVCGGRSGHAEVVNVEFNSDVVTYAALIDIFLKEYSATDSSNNWNPKSPTRSIILYRNKEQEQVVKNKIKERKELTGIDITTEVTALDTFYKAEDYH
jgi:peptide-methionine (S)-S-oxide reductase